MINNIYTDQSLFFQKLFTLVASSGKRNVSVWRLSVRLSVCLSRLFSNVNRARDAYST